MAATHTLPLASPGMARICLYGDLQRFGRRIDLRVKTGAAAIAGSFFTAGATLAAWGAAIGAGGMTGILFSLGASMVLGGVAQMLAPKARTPRTQTTDNGKQNTYFSSLDNMVAQGNVLPVLYGEMRVGSRVVSQEISTADEGDGGQVVVIGR
ncbi:tail assembly protein [Escherichia coli]|nr:tail assembly protein [Escherichia coli]